MYLHLDLHTIQLLFRKQRTAFFKKMNSRFHVNFGMEQYIRNVTEPQDLVNYNLGLEICKELGLECRMLPIDKDEDLINRFNFIVHIKGRTCSVQCLKVVRGTDNFCETMHSFEGVAGFDEPIKHKTPEDFKQYMIRLSRLQ